MKRLPALLLSLLVCLTLFGCSGEPAAQDHADAPEAIPFEEGQLYAIAHVGYQDTTDLELYAPFLETTELPVHYVSSGDYYLVIPRYDDIAMSLVRNDVETGETTLLYSTPACEPFLLQCNISDIFSDATILLARGEETAEFSPFISLENGEVMPGECGLDLTAKG